jgi:hypothetical protein
LIVELEKLGRTRVDFDALGAATTTAEYRDHDEPAHPPRGELTAILRALDHLRWLGAPTDLTRLGRRLVGHLDWEPIRYELQRLEMPLEPFMSHSGPYITGDRLVTPKRGEWRVVAEANCDRTRLVCDPWTADPSQDRGLP